jgi:hypothetical protein
VRHNGPFLVHCLAANEILIGPGPFVGPPTLCVATMGRGSWKRTVQ